MYVGECLCSYVSWTELNLACLELSGPSLLRNISLIY